jgi:hypothetical protein
MIAFPEVMRIKSRIRTGKKYYARRHRKLAACLNADVGDFGDNVVSAVFAFLRRRMSQQRRSSAARFAMLNDPELEQFFRAAEYQSNGKPVRKNAHMRVTRLSRCLTASLSRSRRRMPRPPYRPTASQMVALGILGGQTLFAAVGW